MSKTNGGQALIQSLYNEGVRVVFGLPGMGQYEAVDALYCQPGIRYIATRHEQATSYMADGYARVSGKIAAVLIVPGPGLYNASAGMATACAVSSPMLVVTGTRHHHRSDLDEEASSWLCPLTKWSIRATCPGFFYVYLPISRVPKDFGPSRNSFSMRLSRFSGHCPHCHTSEG